MCVCMCTYSINKYRSSYEFEIERCHRRSWRGIRKGGNNDNKKIKIFLKNQIKRIRKAKSWCEKRKFASSVPPVGDICHMMPGCDVLEKDWEGGSAKQEGRVI